MFLSLVGILLGCLAAWVLVKWWRVRSFWADRGVPYDPPHPILGSLTFLQRENPALWFRRMYEKFRTPYFGAWLFWRPVLVVNCPHVARRVLVKDADVFRNRYLSSGKSDPIGALNIFTVDVSTYSCHNGSRHSFSFWPKDTIVYLRKLLGMIVEQRGGLDKHVTESKDLLDALLQMRQDAAKDNEVISEDLILAQAAVFLQGGFDTSGGILNWAIYELAREPEMQDLLYEELKEAFQKNGNKDLDSSELAELPYLNAVIKEALRKWSPMGWLDRVASRDYKVDEALSIPAGTVVYVNAIGAQWDERHFPSPASFRPQRFLDDADIQPYTYMPFGEGPRNCIGMRFAQLTIRIAMAAVFLKYSVSPAPDYPLPNDVVIEKKGLFLQSGEDLAVIFTPRD